MSKYYVYLARRGLNQTALGVAFYGPDGQLAGSKFRPVDEAVRRGDLPDTLAKSIVPGSSVPLTEDEMERRLSSMANAMSMTTWIVGGATVEWDEASIDRTFGFVVEGRANG